jgi:uncharacterized membrane protein
MRKNIITIHLIILVFFGLILLCQSRFTFLIWNLILAIIPFDLSLLCHRQSHLKQRYLFGIVWLLFFPNALYMMTDFSHLASIGVGLSTPTQFIEYAMYPLFIPKSQLLSRQIATFSLLSICSSIAIYLGRFLRINSWDVLVNLHQTTVQILSVFDQYEFWIFIGAFSILQLMLMLASYQLQKILMQQP